MRSWPHFLGWQSGKLRKWGEALVRWSESLPTAIDDQAKTLGFG